MSVRHRRHSLVPALGCLTLAALCSPAAQAIGCEELRASIVDKMMRGGLARPQIVVMEAADRASGRVVGTCETGTRKLVLLSPGSAAGDAEARLPVQQAAAATVAPAARKPPRKADAKDDEVLVECFDGKHYTDGPCRR